jgi:hypothetical protein
MAISQQMIIHFSLEMGMLIVPLGQAFSYMRELVQQLRGKNLLMIGCCV